MQAMIFAAGLGTRLYPLTQTTPKALVEVGDKSMLERVIIKLRDAGIKKIVVNVHHLPDQIIEFLRNNRNFGAEISISDERDLLLDTGGGILEAKHLFASNEPILIHNADILTDFDIDEMMNAHISSGADATLLTSDRVSSRHLLFDASGIMRGWSNSKTGELRPANLDTTHLQARAFGGVHVISPTLFDTLEKYAKSAGKVFSITPFYIAACSSLKIQSFTPSSPYSWFDIGRPETLAAARAHLSHLETRKSL